MNVTIDLPTLLGLQDNPGELAGYGPLPAPLARMLAADARWRRMILDPLTGHLLDMGHTSYEPSARLARFVKTRDRRCVFPTCNRASQHCEIDHDRPYRPDLPGGGRTDRDNLHPRCGNHHKLKHKTGWTIRTTPITGQSTWTSPLGKHYTVEPEDHRSPALPLLGPFDLPARHRLGEFCAPRGCTECVREVLRLVHHLPVGKLHDGDRVGRHAVVGDDALAHPQVATRRDPQHREVPIGRVPASLRRNRRAAAETFT